MRFIVLGDSKGKDNGVNEKVLTKLLSQSKKLNPEPEFIVLCGDNVAGSSNKDIFMNQLQNLRKLIKKHYPDNALIPVVGNHEVNNEPSDESYEVIFEKAYRDMLPVSCLSGYNNTVYYIDYGSTRLIILNSFHYGEVNKIGQRQLNWFEKAASADIKNKFVFVHSPAFPTGAHFGHCLDLYPEDRDAFWRTAQSCNVDIVFSGHEHNYSRRKKEDHRATYQIITGGGGEKLRDKFKDREGILAGPKAQHHFVVVDVKPDYIELCALNSEGKLLDKFRIKK